VRNKRICCCVVVVAAVIGLRVSLPAAGADVRQPGNEGAKLLLPKPTGPFPVGMRRLAMTDADRDEPATDNTTDHRELAVVLFYPAAEAPPELRAEYMDDYTAKIWAKDSGLWQRFHLNIVTQVFKNAPAAPQPIRLPVVVFSHELFSLPENYQTVLSELASHGFVVAAINHTHASAASAIPPGRFVAERIWPHGFASLENREKALTQYLSTWTDDVRFVISELARLDEEASFFLAGRLNMDRVGVCGHGYGGRAAAAVLDADPRVKAGVTLQAWGSEGARRPAGSDKPLLDIIAQRLEPGAAIGDRRDPATFHLVVDGAVPRSFSDVDLVRARFALRPPDPETAGKIIDPLRAIQITNAYVVAFFDRYLRDGKNDLFDQAKPPFVEAELVR